MGRQYCLELIYVPKSENGADTAFIGSRVALKVAASEGALVRQGSAQSKEPSFPPSVLLIALEGWREAPKDPSLPVLESLQLSNSTVDFSLARHSIGFHAGRGTAKAAAQAVTRGG